MSTTLYSFRPGGLGKMDAPDFSKPHKFSDIVLIAEGQKIHAHRCILAQWSPVFEAMFETEFMEKNQAEIELPGKKHDEMVELLKCIYPPHRGRITEKNFRALLRLADEYQFGEVMHQCEEYLHKVVDKSNALEVLYAAQEYGMRDLYKEAFALVRQQSSHELDGQEFYQNLTLENRLQLNESRVRLLEKTLWAIDNAFSGYKDNLYVYGVHCDEHKRQMDDCKACFIKLKEYIRSFTKR